MGSFMHDDTERWRRLTILDILCLFPAFALGAATVRFFMNHVTPDPMNPRPWPMDATPSSLIFVALVLGSIYAAPISLAVQFIFRRRRVRLNFGEWFWLEPIIMYGFTYLLSITYQHIMLFWIVIALGSQIVISTTALALLALFCLRFFDRKNIVYRWTDILGCLSCSSFGIMIIYLLKQ